MTINLPPEERRALISEAVYSAAKTHGFADFTREHVAELAQCSTGNVSRFFTGEDLRKEALRIALDRLDYDMLQYALSPPYQAFVELPPQVRAQLLLITLK